MFRVTLLPENRILEAPEGIDLLSLLRAAGLGPEAPCGGNGTCGKCTVIVDGVSMPACKTAVDRDMTLELPRQGSPSILSAAEALQARWIPLREGWLLAFDIGTTTVVGYLLAPGTGKEAAAVSCPNPQAAWGADVISRIRHALAGALPQLTAAIREALDGLTVALCQKAGVDAEAISLVCVVGNPAMQQIFLGISPENLTKIPFDAVLKQPETQNAAAFLPRLKKALLLTVPDISGFVGADTVACMLAVGQDRREEPTLLVDIGTNAEMVLGNRQRLIACAAAAGPALEGAGIRFGMGGRAGAIDHVWIEEGRLRCSVIGGGKALGICGSGIIDAVAAGLELGLINSRGRILTESRTLMLTEELFLTQEDVRQVQLAKGAIAAGIRLLAAQWGAALEDIRTVYLAGAFGTFMNPGSACRIGLLPPELEHKIRPIGNAAGAGAKAIAMDRDLLRRSGELAEKTEFLELASLPDFGRCFGLNTRF